MKTSLTTAVLDQLGIDHANGKPTGEDSERVQDVAEHGAAAGWSGFTYYADTCDFYRANRADILALLQDMADSMGEGLLELVAGFRCLEGQTTESEIGECLWGESDPESVTVPNALAWFALEEVCRHLADEMELAA